MRKAADLSAAFLYFIEISRVLWYTKDKKKG